MTPRAISIRINLDNHPVARDLRDEATGAAPQIWRGNAVAIRLGLFSGTTPVSMEGVSSLSLRVKKSPGENIVLASKTTAPDTLADEAAWTAGTAAHAIFDLSDAETNFDLAGETRATCHMVLTALLESGSTRTLATGALTIFEDNDAPADPPPENPGTAITLEEADNRYLQSGTPHTHAWSDLTSGVPTTFPPMIGSGGTQAVAGNDSRLTNARTPTAHKSTHASGGTDILTPADIGAASPEFVTAEIAAHEAAANPHPQYSFIPFWMDPNVSQTYNGGTNSLALYMDSGTTLAGHARNAWFGAGFRHVFLSPGVFDYAINFARTYEVAFTLSFITITGGGRFLLLLGADAAAAGLATAFNYVPSGTQYTAGLEVVGTNARVYSHIAAGLQTGANAPVAQNTTRACLLRLTPTARELWMDGVLVSTVSSGTNNNPAGNVYTLYMAASAPTAGNRMTVQVANLRYRVLP